jgi:putative ABC transport system ATP-binding protein
MIELRNISKRYPRRDGSAITVLNDISLSVEDGEFVAIRGASGSGKSTLLGILGCLDAPTSGTYQLNGRPVESLSERELARVRATLVGFVFQSFHLLPRSTAVENVELAMIYAGNPVSRLRAIAALERVGLGARVQHFPSEMSGGEQQRTAVARALINNPRLILADEPTGNLDAAAAGEVLGLLTSLREEGRTVLVVTHDDAVAAAARRIVRIVDGRISGEPGAASQARPVAATVGR